MPKKKSRLVKCYEKYKRKVNISLIVTTIGVLFTILTYFHPNVIVIIQKIPENGTPTTTTQTTTTSTTETLTTTVSLVVTAIVTRTNGTVEDLTKTP